MITQHTPESLRAFEAEVAKAFNTGRIRAPVHLSGGSEEQIIEIFQEIRSEDWITTNWRSHYHCLLKGVPPDLLMAEILAGRSITLCFPQHRVYSSAIVGGSLPIALGIAKSIKLRGGSERVHAFLGDMTARTGIFHECWEYAYGHGLPIRFVVEDNGLSVCTPTDQVWEDGRNEPTLRRVTYYYRLPWPHSGAGKRVEF